MSVGCGYMVSYLLLRIATESCSVNRYSRLLFFFFFFFFYRLMHIYMYMY